jgi:prevent-host-death family protein
MHMTSREFNQDTARAKREAAKAPVYITDRGRPTHVLVTVEEFERLTGPRKSIADLFYYPGADEVDLPLPERTIEPPREIDWGFDR